MSKIKDITGERHGRLLVVSFAGVSIHNKSLWNCQCDCGNLKTISSNLLQKGKVQSCGCLRSELLSGKNKKHSMSSSKEYKTWCSIKKRCYNTSSEDYQMYGGSGIIMSESLKNNFENFLNEIGECPKDNQRWSVDRIDNSLGYIEGNIRWALDTQQARNKGKYSNNSTGVTGVTFQVNDCSSYYLARWREHIDGESKERAKSFNINKLGKEEAFRLACEYRDKKIAELNSLGYGYSENHGK